jgi:hypothetical protein
MDLKGFLWRVLYAAILVLVLAFVIPLLFEMVGIAIPVWPALTLIRFAFACLVVIYVIFGPAPPAPF